MINRNLLFLFLVILAYLPLYSQNTTFSDDFEAYATGAFVAQSNNKWTTWANKPGTEEDAQISEDIAHSGKKSAKFEALDLTTGGPTDLVLPFFPSAKNAGTFNFEMWMYVVAGNGAYFNFQAVTPIGTTWALSAYLSDAGQLTIGNSTNFQVGEGSFPLDTWFKISAKIDLTLNVWKVFIDDLEVGSFSNPTNSLYAMDIFPVNDGGPSLYYVDDVSYSYTEATFKQLDLNANRISGREYGLAGNSGNISLLVRNIGLDTVKSFDVTFQNGLQVEKASFTSNIPTLGTLAVTHPKSYILVDGDAQVTAFISNINGKSDNDVTNDTARLNTRGYTAAPFKRSVTEEATGTWCQFCPRGAVYLDSMSKTYPKHFIGIAVHNGDPMTISEYDGPFSAYVGGSYPTIALDRNSVIDPSEVEKPMLENLVVAPVAKITNSGAFNSATRELTICVTTEFLQDAPPGYKLNCVITEDSVKGTASGYAQRNAYAGGAQGVMGGYEKLPSTVPASRMQYDHVARAILGPFYGTPNSLPDVLQKGDKVNYTYTYTIPSGQRSNKLNVVTLLFDGDGHIQNAQSTSIDEMLANGNLCVVGTKDVFETNTGLSLSPNPVSDKTQLQFTLKKELPVSLKVYNDLGSTVFVQDFGKLSGKQNITVTAKDFGNGVYFAQLNIDGEMRSIRFVVE